MMPAGEEATVLDIMRYLGMECQHIKDYKGVEWYQKWQQNKKI